METIRTKRLAGMVALAGAIWLGGCQANEAPIQSSTQSLYIQGATRESLKLRTSGKLHWMDSELPADQFAAAAIIELLAAGRPRPRSYETVMVPKLGADDKQHGWYMDYIFYDSIERIIYSARREVR